MTSSVALVRKELRAIAPMALAVAATVLVVEPLDAVGRGLGLLVYLGGSMSLGALLVGHELAHGTLGVLLAQPVERASLLRIKYLVGALALALVSLAGTAAGVFDVLAPSGASSLLVYQAPAFAAALFLAPWLTMVTRQTLAGAVGALASILLLMFVLSLTGTYDAADPNRFVSIAIGMTGLSAVAAVLGWRHFTRRLEDLGASSAGQLHLPSAGRHRAGAFARLVGKELRLQQLPVVLALFYAAAGVLAMTTSGLVPPEVDPRQPHIVWLYGASVALLVGAVASAEERQMGTMPWQMILPVSGRRQFLVKTGVVFTLSLVLATALPELLSLTTPAEWQRFGDQPQFTLTTLGLTMAGLYVSSLTGSSVKAFVGAVPFAAAVVGLTALTGFLARPLGLAVYDIAHPALEPFIQMASEWNTRAVSRVLMSVLTILAVGLAALVWRFAMLNHSRAENAARVARRQLAWVAVFVVVAVAATSSIVYAVASGPRARSGISGVVVDADGNPVAGVSVWLAESRAIRGERWMVPVGAARMSDAEGRFHVTALSRGTYTLLAATGSMAARSGPGNFAPTVHPAEGNGAASPGIVVDGRTTTTGVIIALSEAPTAPVSGRVIDGQGDPIADGLVWLTPLAPINGARVALTASAEVDAEGRFSFAAIPAGEYGLQARTHRGYRAPTNAEYAWMPLSVTGDAVSEVDIVVRPGGRLRGRVEFEGSSPLPDLHEVRLTMIAADLASVGAGWYPVGDGQVIELNTGGAAAAASDRTFDIGPLSGRYYVGGRVRSGDSPWALQEVRLGGRAVTDVALDLRESSVIDNAEVVFTDETGYIAGQVEPDAADSSRTLVVVFPADPSEWEFPNRQRHLISPNADGTFRSPALLPGEYLVVAVGPERTGGLEDLEALAALRPAATPVTVAVGERLEVRLRR